MQAQKLLQKISSLTDGLKRKQSFNWFFRCSDYSKVSLGNIDIAFDEDIVSLRFELMCPPSLLPLTRDSRRDRELHSLSKNSPERLASINKLTETLGERVASSEP